MNRRTVAKHFALPHSSALPANASDPLHLALFAPLHYEPNYAYPLVIWLHGRQGSEHDLLRIMPHLSLRNYVAVAPRGTEKIDRFYDWSRANCRLAEQRVLRCLEAAQTKYNISPRRIYLAGMENGGAMAIEIALRHPEIFAGAISLGGGFPSGGAPLANLEAAREVPLFLTSYQDSSFYPTDRACNDLRLFHAAGLRVMLRQYPGKDGLCKLVLADLDRWIMEQVTQPDESTFESVESQEAL
jgi:phospholipase/carboxylesterase